MTTSGDFAARTVRGDRLTAEETAAAFRAALERVRRSELERGITLVGPHRDDLVLTLNELPARGYASHGESWSFALSLKLASAAVLRRESNSGDPVLILDDVFAELDESRRGRLADAVDGLRAGAHHRGGRRRRARPRSPGAPCTSAPGTIVDADGDDDVTRRDSVPGTRRRLPADARALR